MDWLKGTLEDALRLVAGRRVLAGLVKEALADPSSVLASQEARRQLGVLGVDPATLDQAVRDLRGGRSSPSSAAGRMAGGVPGIGEQLKNVLPAVGVAFQQGRPGDALAQADVLGLKNVLPTSEHFSPGTALLAGGAGLGAAGGMQLFQRGRQLNDLMYGRTGDAVGAMQAELPAEKFKAWDAWRRQTANKPDAVGAVGKAVGGATGFKGKLLAGLGAASGETRRSLFGLDRSQYVGDFRTPKGPAKPQVLFRKDLTSALGRLKPSPLGTAAAVGVPLAAAALPLLGREWLSRGGYRSGRKPIQSLVDANKPPAQK